MCATYLPDCAYISTENYTEKVIFIVFAALFGAWVLVWLLLSICRFMKKQKKVERQVED